MDRPKAYICLVWLVGVASAQTGQQGLTRPTPAVLVTPATNRAQLEPVILTRASLDEKVITLRLDPRVATSIRLPPKVAQPSPSSVTSSLLRPNRRRANSAICSSPTVPRPII